MTLYNTVEEWSPEKETHISGSTVDIKKSAYHSILQADFLAYERDQVLWYLPISSVS